MHSDIQSFSYVTYEKELKIWFQCYNPPPSKRASRIMRWWRANVIRISSPPGLLPMHPPRSSFHLSLQTLHSSFWKEGRKEGRREGRKKKREKAQADTWKEREWERKARRREGKPHRCPTRSKFGRPYQTTREIEWVGTKGKDGLPLSFPITVQFLLWPGCACLQELKCKPGVLDPRFRSVGGKKKATPDSETDQLNPLSLINTFFPCLSEIERKRKPPSLSYADWTSLLIQRGRGDISEAQGG
mmetsp:Transcript_8110/g.15837  ORF Transcript_8110/g.15837 Transcript_8110/m.15837 type:complete len:244 (-) Transcript_8110:341-1072(-)